MTTKRYNTASDPTFTEADATALDGKIVELSTHADDEKPNLNPAEHFSPHRVHYKPGKAWLRLLPANITEGRPDTIAFVFLADVATVTEQAV